jgi:excisionase family DNA binding protein
MTLHGNGVDEYLTTAELARLTRTQPQTWRKRRWHGHSIPFVKIGNRVLYRRSDVDSWLADHTFTSTSDLTSRDRQ